MRERGREGEGLRGKGREKGPHVQKFLHYLFVLGDVSKSREGRDGERVDRHLSAPSDDKPPPLH